jgi:hypothetical protein
VNESRLRRLEGNTELAACRRLAKLARRVPADQEIVEIGAYKGRTSCWLAAGARDGKGAQVTSIDPWNLSEGRSTLYASAREHDKYLAAYETFLKQTDGYAIWSIRAFSLDVARRWNEPIGLLYLDGDHSFEAVCADYAAWSPFIVKGGWIALHDYGNPRLGVRRAVDEVIRPSGLWDREESLLWTRRPERRGLWLARRS